MNIETFQKSFQVREIDFKPYLIVVSIFISIILIIVLLNNKLEDYYISNGKVIDDKLSFIVTSEELTNITNNKKIIIERNIFTYKVNEIKEVMYGNSLYYEVIIELNKIPEDLFINNNVIYSKIIINESTIFDYLIKTAKGEWHIKKISKEELQEMNGGGFLGIAGIITGIVFVIGVIDGFVRPKKCTE